jgi:hypothetical protein
MLGLRWGLVLMLMGSKGLLVFSTFYKDNGIIDQNYIENHYVLGLASSILHSHVVAMSFKCPNNWSYWQVMASRSATGLPWPARRWA